MFVVVCGVGTFGMGVATGKSVNVPVGSSVSATIATVGFLVGLPDGVGVGFFVGLLDGETVGFLVGLTDGSGVGNGVGLPVTGDAVGKGVGAGVGSGVGSRVGKGVGFGVGSLEGDTVGSFEGSQMSMTMQSPAGYFTMQHCSLVSNVWAPGSMPSPLVHPLESA